MGKIETVLVNCIKEIKSGKASLAECLDRHPSMRQELEPLLKVALNIKEPRILNMDTADKQAGKALLLKQIRTVRQKKSGGFANSFSFGLPPQFAWARVAVSIIVLVIILSTLAGGTAYASQSSLPGDLLYLVKIGTENARILIAGDSYQKAELNLKFAQTRLEEISNLVSGDEESTELAINGYRNNLDAAGEHTRAVSDASALSKLLDAALAGMQSQITFCDNVIDAGSGNLDPVKEASSLNIRAQVEFIRMLEQQNNLQAAQANLNAMQNRLQRARSKASANQYQIMEEALLQYRQFNELGAEILEIAQNTNKNNNEIETLNRETLSSYLDTLDSIAEETPEEYQNTVEACKQRTLQVQTRAHNRNQHQDEPGPEGQSQNPGNGGRPDREQDMQGNPQSRGEIENTDDETPVITPTPSSENRPETDENNGNNSDASPGRDNGAGPVETPGPYPDNSGSTGNSGGSGSDNTTDIGRSGGGSPPSLRGNAPPASGPRF